MLVRITKAVGQPEPVPSAPLHTVVVAPTRPSASPDALSNEAPEKPSTGFIAPPPTFLALARPVLRVTASTRRVPQVCEDATHSAGSLSAATSATPFASLEASAEVSPPQAEAQEASTMFLRGSKTAGPSEALQNGETRQAGYSFVSNAADVRTIMTKTMTFGSHGKGRFAFRHVPMFVKEVRFPEACDAKPNAKTRVMQRARVHQEIHLLKTVEPELEVYDTVEVQDRYHVHWGKGLIMMKWMLGDADALVSSELPLRELTGRLLLMSVARSVARCHAAGYIHRDLKLGNILWDKTGAFYLSDFGLAGKMDASGRCYKEIGTWSAPEMFSKQLGEGRLAANPEGYTQAVDAWGLGMTMATFHCSWRDNPLADIGGHLKRQSAQGVKQVFDDYAAWRARYADSDGKIDVSKFDLDKDKGTPFERWTSYFSQVRDGDSGMCDIILNLLLVPEPEKRVAIGKLIESQAEGEAKLSAKGREKWRTGLEKFAERFRERENLMALLRELSDSDAVAKAHQTL